MWITLHKKELSTSYPKRCTYDSHIYPPKRACESNIKKHLVDKTAVQKHSSRVSEMKPFVDKSVDMWKNS